MKPGAAICPRDVQTAMTAIWLPAKEQSVMKTARFCLLTAIMALVVFTGPQNLRGEEVYNENLRFVPGFQLQGGRIGTGNFRLLAGVGLEAEYSDNINFSSSGERKDWIGHVLSSVYLDKVFDGTGGMRLGYEGDWAFYKDFGENDWMNNLGRFDLDYFGNSGLIARIRSSAGLLEDVYGNENEYNLGIATKRSEYDLKSRVGWEFARRFRLMLLGDFFRSEYDDIVDFTQNWDEWTAGAGAEVRVTDKSWLFLRYGYGERQYSDLLAGVTAANVADYDYQRLTTGVGWDLGAQFSGEAWFGYQQQSFKNTLDAAGLPFRDKDTWIANAAVHYRPTGKAPFEPAETSILTVNFWRTFIPEGADTRDYYVETGINGVVRSEIFTNALLLWGLDYYLQEYENATKEKAGNGKAAIELMYKIKQWLAIGVGTDWQKKNSNQNINDYEVIRFFFSLKGAV